MDGAAQARRPAERVRAVVDSVARAASGSIAGFAVAVVHRGDTLFIGSRGYADASARTAIPAGAVFEVGSIAKQFTAAAIYRLVEQGRVELDRPAGEYLPALPMVGAVTVRQLLDHTSGIPDLAAQPAFRWGNEPAPGLEHLIPIALKGAAPHLPGAGMTYSNTNYLVLAGIIEAATGESYPAFIDRELFTPAGMDSTSVCDERPVRRFVRPHGRVGKEQQPFEFLDLSWWLGASALCSSLDDLLAWNDALHGGKILSPISYADMVRPGAIAGGLRTRYAAGLMVDSIFGRPVHRHGGSIPGFRAYLAHFPEDDLSIVVLANSTELNPTALGETLAHAALGAEDRDLPSLPGAGEFVGRYTGKGRFGPTTIALTMTPGGDLTWGAEGRPGARLYLREPDLAESAARDRLRFVRDQGRVIGLWLDRVGGMFYLRKDDLP